MKPRIHRSANPFHQPKVQTLQERLEVITRPEREADAWRQPLPTRPNSWRCKMGRHDIRDHHGKKTGYGILITSGLGMPHPLVDKNYCKRCGKTFNQREAFGLSKYAS